MEFSPQADRNSVVLDKSSDFDQNEGDKDLDENYFARSTSELSIIPLATLSPKFITTSQIPEG
jgi:hypothetical protein